MDRWGHWRCAGVTCGDPALSRPLCAIRTPEKVRAQAKPCARWSGRPAAGSRPRQDAGAEDLIHQRGHLYVYRSVEALAKDSFAGPCGARRGRRRRIRRDELRQLEPPCRADYVRGLLVRENAIPRTRSASSPGSSSNFSGKAARSSGRARLVSASTAGAGCDPHRRREYPADAAIVCAGAYSKPLAASLGDHVLSNRARLHLMIAIRNHAAHPNSRCRRQIRRVPMALGCALPARSNWPASPRRGLAACRILLTQGQKMLPGLAADYPTSGSRCGWGTARRCPIHCRARGLARQPRCDLCFGHGHVGMTARR